MKRFLITTADERIWKFDRSVLFLGEWCRLYDRKHIWEEMDAVVAAPYGVQRGQKEHDHAYTQALFTQLLLELAHALNTFHQTHYSVRYWHILIGHWLERCVETAFNRYFTVEQVLKTHAISGTTVFDFANYNLATTNSQAFVWAADDDVWNHVFYAKLLAYFGDVEVEKDVEGLRGVCGFDYSSPPTTPRSKTKHLIWDIATSILPKFSGSHDAFIIGSYLPQRDEIKLQLSLGQCPQLWCSPSLRACAVNRDERQGFRLTTENHTGFERFLRSHLGDLIPTCYLEGYPALAAEAASVPWPTKPKFIFTSNNFDGDEIFKTWAASMVERGVPYFTGQHGNNYSTALDVQDPPELVTCDKFFTWGWTNDDPRNIPAFVFKTVGRTPRRRPVEGGLLLIEIGVPHRMTVWDSYFEFGIYQEEQYRFVNALPDAIREQLTVRLYHPHRHLRWSAAQRWRDRSPQTRIDPGTTKIWDATAQSRLVVHSYDSTGILETLALNIPTLCFWYGGLDHLLSSARPYYELLRKADILLDTPERAAEIVALQWEDVSAWWNSEKVQNARKIFCERYARTTKHPVRTMKRLLTDQDLPASSYRMSMQTLRSVVRG